MCLVCLLGSRAHLVFQFASRMHFFSDVLPMQRKTVAEIAFSPLQHFFSLSLYRHLLLSLITGDTFNNIWPSSFGSPRDVQLFALEETRRAMSHRWWTNSLSFGGGSEYFRYNYKKLLMEEILHYTNWYGKCIILYRVFYIPAGAGFLPSTVFACVHVVSCIRANNQ